jgi:hypothetical protein
MKTINLLAFALTIFCMSFSPVKVNEYKMPSKKIVAKKGAVKWKKTETDLGEIPQSKPVTIEFEFMNTGDSPVVIMSVQASCGCTSTDYVKTPIEPGKSAKVSAIFNAAAKGVFKKTVTVFTDADASPQVLMFTGTVI